MTLSWLCGHYLDGSAPENGLKAAPFAERQGGEFKSRDVTLPKKVHLVKAMVFPVVMYGCASYTVKKAEH